MVSDKIRAAVDQRRIRVFFMEERILIPVLRGEVRVAELPPDVFLFRVQYDYSRLGFALYFVHPTFDPIAAGEQFPNHGPVRFVVEKRDIAPVPEPQWEYRPNTPPGNHIKFREFL